MSNCSVYIDRDLDDGARREQLYQGYLLVYSPSPATADLVALGRELLDAAFAPHDPRTVHRDLSPEQVDEILGVMKPRFIHHPQCKVLIRRIHLERGMDLERTYFDVPRIRTAYLSDSQSCDGGCRGAVCLPENPDHLLIGKSDLLNRLLAHQREPES